MNLSLDLWPVAKAVAAGAESVINDSALYVRTPPTRISSKAKGTPFTQRAIVVCAAPIPSATKTMMFWTEGVCAAGRPQGQRIRI
jgi:hypothetical protein